MSAAVASRRPTNTRDTSRPGHAERTWRAAILLFRRWQRRVRERRELAQLTDRELYDFGASRSDVIAELRKPFWRD